MVSIHVLRQIACFHSLGQEQLEAIGRRAEIRTVRKGAFLFRTGDHADALYILVSGRLAVTRDDAKGRALELATIESGSCLGEMGLSQGLPRSADVMGSVDSVLVCIHRHAFESLVQEQPVFALLLLADLSKKLHEANRRFENRVTLPVKGRLWAVLCKLTQDGSIKAPPKIAHLAVKIDATREMTSKALSQLVLEGRIEKTSAKLWRINRNADTVSRHDPGLTLWQ